MITKTIRTSMFDDYEDDPDEYYYCRVKAR